MNRCKTNTNIPTQILKINLKTIYNIQTHKINKKTQIQKQWQTQIPKTMYKSTNNYIQYTKILLLVLHSKESQTHTNTPQRIDKNTK